MYQAEKSVLKGRNRLHARTCANPIVLAVAGLLACAVPAASQVALPPTPPTAGFSTPRFGVTVVDLGSGKTGSPAIELTRFYDSPVFWRVGVGAGLTVSARGAVYGYGGLHLPLELPGGLIARPSVSFGLYEGGSGMDLGHVIEFRSGIVLERQIADRLLLSGLLYHMSNAGLGRRNPGMEGLGIGVTFLGESRETTLSP